MIKVVKVSDNFMVDIEGRKYPIGKLNDDQLKSLEAAGKYRKRTGDKLTGHQMVMFALMERIDRGIKVRKI